MIGPHIARQIAEGEVTIAQVAERLGVTQKAIRKALGRKCRPAPPAPAPTVTLGPDPTPALVQMYRDGQSVNEIARNTGLGKGTVYYRLAAAKVEFRKPGHRRAAD